MKKPKAPKLVTIAILTLITVIFWIFFGVFRILTSKPTPPVSQEILNSLVPVFDQKILSQMKQRIFFER